ncbi:uncharacterized protein N7515_003100 [Penicillium bovifimosum]|uniref:Uncharacterized protein n=1 Tax=Penicillium bovifimosum TaxID=126998 RepID=A0A9W9L5W9_9EURO|nr:uncharacterized protein N7515_003100 [Penicillium bovifimosum]KAJ5138252.1 hypothetical protein N7515_003100 [Penicillium bovifimosum]
MLCRTLKNHCLDHARLVAAAGYNTSIYLATALPALAKMRPPEQSPGAAPELTLQPPPVHGLAARTGEGQTRGPRAGTNAPVPLEAAVASTRPFVLGLKGLLLRDWLAALTPK